MTLRTDLAERADEVRETHISWVFLDASSAYKVKKPVSLGFLDFSTLEQRRAACEAEVTLNTRLAPDVYLGVREVVRDTAGRHSISDASISDASISDASISDASLGEVVDYAVHMRRLADEDRADVRLTRGTLGLPEVDRIAARIAAFHAAARCDDETRRYGAPELVSHNVRENFAQTREVIGELLTTAEAEEIEAWQLRFLREREHLLRARAERGRVRDGHGDLRLEHVYLEGERLRIIDCIEFNERFRYADVCSDLAFLSMDLAWHGRVDLAERLLATYARETSDFELYAAIDFYESYRAYVRGKVATILAADEAAPARRREGARQEARRYFLLALAAERRPLIPPLVVAIGGGLATGKSTLADALGAKLGAPAINTDRVRKHLLGARPTERLYDGSWSGAYDPSFTEAVYAEVNRGAQAVVGSGRPVILDASFRAASHRARAKALAESLGVPFVLVECRADPDVCRRRLAERAKGESVSDGRLEIFDDFVARWEPVTEVPADEHVVVHTDRPMEEVFAVLEARLPLWPTGLTG